MNSFESRLLGQIRRGKILLAAVSGGADSAAMLAGLEALRNDAGFGLHCVHVEHGIRPAGESEGDARAVEELCKKLKVSCRVVSVPRGKVAAFASLQGSGIEAAARFFRHGILSEERKRIKADWILTGHTRDDILETLLMRILRGSGPSGLALMPRVRGRLLRPLLEFTRQDVLEYLETRGLSYRTDATNKDTVFLRNRIRLRLVPFLDEFFPSWRTSLLAMGETQSLAAGFLADEAGKRLVWDKNAGMLMLPEEDFLKAPQILREEAIFAGVDMLVSPGSQQLAPSHKRPLLRPPRRAALRRAAAGGAASDLGPVRLERRKGFITLSPVKKIRRERGFSLLIKEAGLYTLKGRVWSGEKNAADLVIRAGKDGLPLVFRNHREGDRILRGGHRRRFSDILDYSGGFAFLGIITAFDVDGAAAFIALDRQGKMKVTLRDGFGERGFCFFELLFKKDDFRG